MLAFIILYSLGNLSAIDAFFLAVSGNTESGLNTYAFSSSRNIAQSQKYMLTCIDRFDVKDLNVAQQLVLYFFPVITNLCFINIGLVIIRLSCFEKRLKTLGMNACLTDYLVHYRVGCLLDIQIPSTNRPLH